MKKRKPVFLTANTDPCQMLSNSADRAAISNRIIRIVMVDKFQQSKIESHVPYPNNILSIDNPFAGHYLMTLCDKFYTCNITNKKMKEFENHPKKLLEYFRQDKEIRDMTVELATKYVDIINED